MHREESLAALAPLTGSSLFALAADLAVALHASRMSGSVAPGMVLLGPDGVRLDGLDGVRPDAPVPPEFVAPEVLAGAVPGPASQAYSLGKVVLYAATGSPSLDQDLRVLPEPLRGLVARSVAARPERRPLLRAIPAALHPRRPRLARLRRAMPSRPHLARSRGGAPVPPSPSPFPDGTPGAFSRSDSPRPSGPPDFPGVTPGVSDPPDSPGTARGPYGPPDFRSATPDASGPSGFRDGMPGPSSLPDSPDGAPGPYGPAGFRNESAGSVGRAGLGSGMPGAARPAGSRRAPWLWAGLAVGLVLALVAGGVVVLRGELFGGGPDETAQAGEPTRTPAASEPPRSDEPLQTEELLQKAGAHEPRRANRVFAPASKAAPGGGLIQTAMDAAVVDRTVVVVGVEIVGSQADYRPIFVVSDDGGKTWQAARSQKQSAFDFPRFVAGGPKGWVALPSDPAAGLTGWTSEDGRRWEAIPAAGVAGMKDHGITGLVATRDGFVASGALDGAGPPSIWTSADGRSWERAPMNVNLLHGLNSVLVAHGDQVMIAGTPRYTPDAEPDVPLQVVARSGDGGRTWQRSAPPTGDLNRQQAKPFQHHYAWYATDGKAFYAAYNEGQVTRVVRAARGGSWQRVGTYEGKGQAAAGLAAGPTGFYLLSRPTGDAEGTIVHSTDGSVWTPLGSSRELGGSDLPLLQPTATGLLARHDGGGGMETLGRGTPGGDRLRLLVATPGEGLAPFEFPGVKALSYPVTRINALDHRNGRTVAVGQSLGMASAWWSTDDGATWTRSSLETPGELTGLASGPEGRLAIGDGKAYVSRDDGRTWQRTAAELGRIRQVAAAKNSYLLTIVKDGKAEIWRSTDLSTWQKADVSGQDFLHVLAGGELGYVFAPYGCRENGSACVWFSADGLTWRQLMLPGVDPSESINVNQVAVGSDAMVIAGTISARGSEEYRDFVARSGADGVWTKTILQEGRSITAIRPADGGWTGIRTTGQEIAVVRSQDGLTWEPVATTAARDRTFGAGLEISGTFLATGFVRTMTEDYPIMWRIPKS